MMSVFVLLNEKGSVILLLNVKRSVTLFAWDLLILKYKQYWMI